MKNLNLLSVLKSWLTIAFLMLLSFSLLAQQNPAAEVPVTTTNDEARKLFIEARDYAESAQFAAANGLLDKALALDPDFASAHLLKSYVTQSKQQLSAKHLLQAVALQEKVSEGEQLLIVSAKAERDNNMQAAGAALDKLVQLYPQDKHVNLYRGHFYYSQNQMDKAIEALQMALTVDLDFAPAYNLLGYAYSHTQEYGKAEQAYKDYIKLAPQLANPYDSMGDFYMKQGKYAEAITNYKKAAALDPSFNFSLTKIGHNLVLMGKLDESRKAYQFAESKAANHAEKVDNLLAEADSYLSEGRYKEALQVSDKAAKILKDNNDAPYLAWVYLGNGEVYTLLNDLPKAKKNLQEVKMMVSSSKLSPRQSDRLNQALLFVEGIMATKSKDFAVANSKAAELKAHLEASANPDAMQEYHKLAGIISYEGGDMEKALAHLEQADQRSPRVLYLQWMAQAKNGNIKKSEEFKKKLNALNELGFEYALVRATMAKAPKVAATN